jgi:hypothetical protein
MSFTYALRIYFGIWPAVTVKFRADQIEPGGFLSMGECHFFYPVTVRCDVTNKKMTEYEVAEVTAPEIIIRSNQSPLTFPAGDQ